MLGDLIGAVALCLHAIEAGDQLHHIRSDLLDNDLFTDGVQTLVAMPREQVWSAMCVTTSSTFMRIDLSPSTSGWLTLMLNMLMSEAINTWMCCSYCTMNNNRFYNMTKLLSTASMVGETEKVMTHQSLS